jgi:hypothetical protein
MECSFSMGTSKHFRGQKVSGNSETGKHCSLEGAHNYAAYIRKKLYVVDISTRKIK